MILGSESGCAEMPMDEAPLLNDEVDDVDMVVQRVRNQDDRPNDYPRGSEKIVRLG